MRFLIFLLLAYLFYRLLRGVFSPGREIKKTTKGGAIDEMVQDPLCKTYIPLRDAKRKVIDGKEYFFCSDTCANQFQREMTKEE